MCERTKTFTDAAPRENVAVLHPLPSKQKRVQWLLYIALQPLKSYTLGLLMQTIEPNYKFCFVFFYHSHEGNFLIFV